MLETAAGRVDVSAAVTEAVAAVMRQRGLDAAAIEPDAKLADTLGLKSMDLAQIVLDLEDTLEADPFATIPITSIRTIGDLTRAYETTLSGAAAASGPDLAAEMEAARSRRAGRRR